MTSQTQLSNLVKFTKHASFLGGGLVLIDVGTRAGNVHISKLSGENWHRKLFIESLSFAGSTSLGVAGVRVGLQLLLVATPVGWGLIIGGLSVAGVAAGVSMGFDSYLKSKGGSIYDAIMKGI